LEIFTYNLIFVGVISASVVQYSLENVTRYVYLETHPPWVETIYKHIVLQPNGR